MPAIQDECVDDIWVLLEKNLATLIKNDDILKNRGRTLFYLKYLDYEVLTNDNNL